jgi:hypothetical protein
MNNFRNHQRPRREYRFDIVDHEKALKIWRDSTFKRNCSTVHIHPAYKMSRVYTMLQLK